MRTTYGRLLSIAGASLAMVGFASATDYFESEPNDSKAAANMFNMLSGDRIIGNSISAATTGLDYFLVRTAGGSTPGIYMNRMTLTTSGTAGHTGTLRGLNQTGTASTFVGGVVVPGTGGTIGVTDTTLQTTSTTTTPPRFNQWYTFGRAADMYYRVTGTATTTADYEATLTSSAVTPTHLGSFQPGNLKISTINQGHTSDTEILVYDSNFNAMAGYLNDDYFTSTGTGVLQAELNRSFGAGRYYLAISNFNTANNLASPTDERTPTGAVTDFADVLVNTSTTVNVNIGFAITDGLGTTQFQATKVGPYDVNFYSIDVVPEPASMAALGLGALALIRRRKRA
jgi:hypothetical protein